MLKIEEVIKRSTQGVTHPFICKDSEGRELWVKGKSWLPSDLASEWICGNIAKAWGLPIADFDLVFVDKDLIDFSAVPEIISLGAGYGFGSVHVQGASELDFSDIEKIDPEWKADLLLFDYWVQNEDRTLSAQGGNPNLLWKLPGGGMVVIDHNNAFDQTFTPEKLFEHHVFAEMKALWTPEYQGNRQEKMLGILEKLPDMIASLPESWFENDDNSNNPLASEVERMQNVLSKIQDDAPAFWRVTA
jgi:hypothetical protein